MSAIPRRKCHFFVFEYHCYVQNNMSAVHMVIHFYELYLSFSGAFIAKKSDTIAGKHHCSIKQTGYLLITYIIIIVASTY